VQHLQIIKIALSTSIITSFSFPFPQRLTYRRLPFCAEGPTTHSPPPPPHTVYQSMNQSINWKEEKFPISISIASGMHAKDKARGKGKKGRMERQMENKNHNKNNRIIQDGGLNCDYFLYTDAVLYELCISHCCCL
jgi:hypothetical protein